MEAFKDSIADVKAHLVDGTFEYVSRDLYPIISPHQPNDELFGVIRKHIQMEFDVWFHGLEESAGN